MAGAGAKVMLIWTLVSDMPFRSPVFGMVHLKVVQPTEGSCLPKCDAVDSRYLGPRDFLKYFEISVPRHIRFAKLRKKWIEQPHFTNEYIIKLLKLEIYWKYCGKEEKLLLFSTIFYHLLLGFHVKTETRFSLRDKRLFEMSGVEITRVDCICDFWGSGLIVSHSSYSNNKFTFYGIYKMFLCICVNFMYM